MNAIAGELQCKQAPTSDLEKSTHTRIHVRWCSPVRNQTFPAGARRESEVKEGKKESKVQVKSSLWLVQEKKQKKSSVLCCWFFLCTKQKGEKEEFLQRQVELLVQQIYHPRRKRTRFVLLPSTSILICKAEQRELSCLCFLVHFG